MSESIFETYVSTDVDADGPIPGPHSMSSFASAAHTEDKQLLNTFTANLETLPGTQGHPKTMAWWQSKPEAWNACRRDLESPESAMRRYVGWLKMLPARRSSLAIALLSISCLPIGI